MSDWAEEKAEAILTEFVFVKDFLRKTFPKAKPTTFENISKSWEYLIPVFSQSLREAHEQGRKDGLEEAARVVEDISNSNVENPAMDWFELHRLMGIRWCGEYSVRQVRFLASQKKGDPG